jgi:cytochrome P450
MLHPPHHPPSRRLDSRGFTPPHVDELEPQLRAYVRTRVDELVAACAASGGSVVDFVAALARPTPSWVVAHYLGVPVEDRARFDEWTHAIVGQVGDVGDALAGLYGYFTELVARRRGEGAVGDDLVSILLRADDDGAGIGLEGVLGYAFVMIAGGNDTATGLLAGSAALLAAHPDQRRTLVDDPARIPGAVDELLRLTSPVQGLCRVATRDVEIHNTTIAAGDRVLLCYGAANRDPREFGNTADALDVTRPVPRLLTFAAGAHYCLGAAAARLQARVVLEELLARCPDYAVDADGGVFADGAFTRRYESLPFTTGS